MPDILDLVEAGCLESVPPRRLPAFFLPNLIGEHLLERPLKSYFSLFFLACLAGAAVLAAAGAPRALSLALLALAVARVLGPTLRLARDVRDDYLLVRYGQILTAHVMGVRPCHEQGGARTGAYLDCAVPISRRSTSVGSVWVADVAEAMHLSAQGKLTVICLPRAPGSWRLYRPPAT